MPQIDIDFSEFEELQKKMEEYGEGSLRIINDVIHGEGGQKIKDNIHMLIPASGRTWRGKKPPASVADSLQQVNSEMLAVTIKTKNAYGYLYFPDDGAGSRHGKNLQFFKRGAEESTPQVVELCIGKLIENF